ncbi:sugar phosphate isomerase/epimerase [Pedobacter sp. BS3]|uniref:sugar phosphate isomerase/epimerase family protein n=1 Tax=Pedobacter sp. BS3 TaxID=2567937 RepID=UPI0011EF204C|nr:sugar phosphate isomerase/epimerase [Pedobacter sp. BS3]TZF84773.1 sugar phosphate isomerase/epimerase [Pedobacter sp. BS3]
MILIKIARISCLAAGMAALSVGGFAKPKAPKPLRVGYSIAITSITPEKMKYAKSVGVDCIEIGPGALIDKKTGGLAKSDEACMQLVAKAKKAADDAGIEIWSVHMPFGEKIDISLGDEAERQRVVALHKKLLGFYRVLKPKIVLFHPSWFLGLNERELRKSQMIRSALELNQVVKRMKAKMVIENMLGPTLLRDATHERPLCRTVEETVEIMNKLPSDIYSAVDMNHIKNPEKLIAAMGERLKTVHVSDGNGEAECHYLPCSGKGKNDWNAILSALQEAHYTGPFLYESAYKDVKELPDCYRTLYHNFIAAKYPEAK